LDKVIEKPGEARLSQIAPVDPFDPSRLCPVFNVSALGQRTVACDQGDAPAQACQPDHLQAMLHPWSSFRVAAVDSFADLLLRQDKAVQAHVLATLYLLRLVSLPRKQA
jgi:hypothetical protein